MLGCATMSRQMKKRCADYGPVPVSDPYAIMLRIVELTRQYRQACLVWAKAPLGRRRANVDPIQQELFYWSEKYDEVIQNEAEKILKESGVKIPSLDEDIPGGPIQ